MMRVLESAGLGHGCHNRVYIAVGYAFARGHWFCLYIEHFSSSEFCS